MCYELTDENHKVTIIWYIISSAYLAHIVQIVMWFWNENHKCYLGSHTYEFTYLPFGLYTASYVFTKILKPVISHLCKLGLASVIYLDDSLLFGESYSICIRNIEITTTYPKKLGFVINVQKSQMNPAQACKYLGFLYNSKKMIVELSDSKRNPIKTEVYRIELNQSIKIRDFARIVGILVSYCPAVNYG